MAKDYDVPFFANTSDDTHCLQAALRMVLKYFHSDRDYSWEELDRITTKESGAWTWPMAGYVWLQENGFELHNIESFDYPRFLKEGAGYLEDAFGTEAAQTMVEKSSLPKALEEAREFVRKVETENRAPDLEELIEYLEQGFLVICNVNSRALRGRAGWAGHFIVVKGFEGDQLILHDPGPPPCADLRVTKADFHKAWAAPNDNFKNLLAVR